MKELAIKIFWTVVCIAAMVWFTYQSWDWFFTEKLPTAPATPIVIYKTEKLEDIGLQPFEQVQLTGEVQTTTPSRMYDLPFTGTVCGADKIEAINKEIAEIEALLQAKPSFAYDTEYGTRLAELQNACK